MSSVVLGTTWVTHSPVGSARTLIDRVLEGECPTAVFIEALWGSRGQAARSAANAAHKSGKLKKPGACQCCKRKCRKLVKHHTDYRQPLNIKWLCPGCHGEEHGKASAP